MLQQARLYSDTYWSCATQLGHKLRNMALGKFYVAMDDKPPSTSCCRLTRSAPKQRRSLNAFFRIRLCSKNSRSITSKRRTAPQTSRRSCAQGVERGVGGRVANRETARPPKSRLHRQLVQGDLRSDAGARHHRLRASSDPAHRRTLSQQEEAPTKSGRPFEDEGGAGSKRPRAMLEVVPPPVRRGLWPSGQDAGGGTGALLHRPAAA